MAASKHYVFDAFGTLFDVHSVARDHAELIGPQAARLSEIWRAKQLEYTWIYAGLGEHIPFRNITGQALDFALRQTGIDRSLAPCLLAAYARLQTFPEVSSVLQALKDKGAKLAILSNGDTDMLDDLVEGAGLTGMFDALITVRVAGTFKPRAKVYALATEVFGVAPGDITFLSSNRWDIAGASHFGFSCVWINRVGAPDEYPEFAPAQVFASLSPLAKQ